MALSSDLCKRLERTRWSYYGDKLTQKEKLNLLLLEDRREEAVEKVLKDEKILIRCLLCSKLRTVSGDGNSYRLPIHCGSDRDCGSAGRSILFLKDLKSPAKECKGGCYIRDSILHKIVNERMRCTGCKGNLNVERSNHTSCSYTPEGEAGIFRNYQTDDHYFCSQCGTIYSLMAMQKKATFLIYDYLQQHNLLVEGAGFN